MTRYYRVLLFLVVAVPAVALLAAGMGAYPVAPWDVPRALVEGGAASDVLRIVRFPRIALAFVVGAALGLAGAVLQGVFRNPLADPGLIGVTAGASVGAAATIVLIGYTPMGVWTMPFVAFAGGAAATAIVWKIARQDGRVSTATLLLSGVALNSIATAAIGVLIFLADDQQLRTLTFWTLGGLGAADWRLVLATAMPALIGALLLLRLGPSLNALALGEGDAYHLGVPVQTLKRTAVFAAALVVGAAVAAAGGIGFIGLVVPHVFRLAAGPDHRYLLPGSMLGGGCVLVLADTAARTIVAPAELPVGVCTSLLGGPFFLWLLLRFRREVVLA